MRSIHVLLAVSFALAVSVTALLVVKTRTLHSPALPQARILASSAAQADDSAPPIDPCRDIYRTVCRKRGLTRDPTGSVQPDVAGELRALRTYEEILRKNPEWTSEQADEEFVRLIYTPKAKARMESAYRWVRHAMEALIERQPEEVFNAQEKKQLKKRLREVELQLPPPASVYADEPDLLTKNDAFYERLGNGRMRLRVGGAYLLTAKSWFNIVFTFAHELAHAIDPCEIRSSNRLSFPAYDRVSACFLAKKLVASRKTRSECGRNDQLSEAFADWLAVEISAEALQSFSAEYKGRDLLDAAINSVRDLCEQEDDPYETDTEFHPSPKVRIEQIFGSNPRIRGLLGCAPAPGPESSCDFQWRP